jgi:hypothetical protein
MRQRIGFRRCLAVISVDGARGDRPTRRQRAPQSSLTSPSQAVLALTRRRVDVLWAMLRDRGPYEGGTRQPDPPLDKPD